MYPLIRLVVSDTSLCFLEPLPSTKNNISQSGTPTVCISPHSVSAVFLTESSRRNCIGIGIGICIYSRIDANYILIIYRCRLPTRLRLVVLPHTCCTLHAPARPSARRNPKVDKTTKRQGDKQQHEQQVIITASLQQQRRRQP
ncbi:hypothetical protein VD0004_g7013 [Verticillium dahliae]|nr:hypothetical protein VD0004_g7013 [Verticillium dahliae]PNH71602.1 hypothetical protein VD0001_g5956 [Verticillium dahliae]